MNIEDNKCEEEKIRMIFLKRLLFILFLLAAVISILSYSVTVGTADISVWDVYRTLIDAVLPGTFEIGDRTRMIIIDIRLPRVLMALIGGAILAVGGCLTQSILRNPLATPYTLGVSSGAGFGAAIAILMGMTLVSNVVGVIVNAFVFALIPIAVVLTAGRARDLSSATMVLCGVAMSYIFSAANTLLQFFGDPNAVKAVVFWMVGDLNNIFIWHIPFVLITLIMCLVTSAYLSKNINAMRLGDDTARSLGVNTEAVRTITLLVACLSTAMVVCFTGSIGFICLLAPHISRVFVGGDMKYLVPASALCGSALLLLADLGAKMLAEPIMLPVGAITAMVGGPLLLYLLLRRKSDNAV